MEQIFIFRRLVKVHKCFNDNVMKKGPLFVLQSSSGLFVNEPVNSFKKVDSNRSVSASWFLINIYSFIGLP